MTTLTMPRRLMAPVATPPARRSLGAGLLVGLGAGLLALVLLSVGVGLASAGTVMPGVRVAGVDLAGLDRAGAASRLEAALPSISDGSATLVVDEVSQEIVYGDLGRRYDVDATLDVAFGVARSGGPLAEGINRLRTLVHATSLAPVVHGYDDQALHRAAVSFAELTEVAPTDATILRQGARFDVSPAYDGRRVDPDAVKSALAAFLVTADPANVVLEIEPTSVEPAVTNTMAWRASLAAQRMAQPLALNIPGAAEDEERHAGLDVTAETVAGWIGFGPTDDAPLEVVLDEAAVTATIGALSEVIDQEAANAGFTVAGSGLGGVIPSRDGRTLHVEESVDELLALLEERTTGRAAPALLLDVETVEASFTTEQAEAAFPEMRMVSSWTTNYVPGIANGWGANISIPAGDIDGTTVAPGDWFSFWGGLGPINTARGYTYGGAIINGRSEPTGALAGGICSASTTLFNAAMRFGLEIGARDNHYYYIDRYPIGLDATVFKGEGIMQDMTFRNDTDAPVVIRGFGSPGRVTFQLWSVPNGREVVLSQPYTANFRGATDTTRLDPSMAPGTSERIESPHNGFDATVTRTVYDADGTQLHRDVWFSDYRAVNGVVLVGPDAPAELPPQGTTGTGGGGEATP